MCLSGMKIAQIMEHSLTCILIGIILLKKEYYVRSSSLGLRNKCTSIWRTAFPVSFRLRALSVGYQI